MRGDSIAEQVKEILEEYSDEVEELLQYGVDEAAADAQVRLKTTSPKKSGNYKSGWQIKRLKKKAVVYNANAPGLTQLLEYGHVKKPGTGRVPGTPHIKPAEEQAERYFIDIIIEGLEDIGAINRR